jgi:VIT1/CCC1 family predicted Fe2+/Mn2+ transporter
MRQRKAAWKQQQRASKEYAREAWRNGYPGAGYQGAGNPGQSGAAAQAGAAVPPNWSPQWSPNWYAAAQPPYRKGPNVAAIVWGGITLIAGVVALLWFLLPDLFVSANIWAIILSIGFAAIGLSLVIGAIVTSISGMRHKHDAPSDEGYSADYGAGYSAEDDSAAH